MYVLEIRLVYPSQFSRGNKVQGNLYITFFRQLSREGRYR